MRHFTVFKVLTSSSFLHTPLGTQALEGTAIQDKIETSLLSDTDDSLCFALRLSHHELGTALNFISIPTWSDSSN